MTEHCIMPQSSCWKLLANSHYAATAGIAGMISPSQSMQKLSFRSWGKQCASGLLPSGTRPGMAEARMMHPTASWPECAPQAACESSKGKFQRCEFLVGAFLWPYLEGTLYLLGM